MTTPHVDCHSHIFNAEDLPIDGFIKSRLWKVPEIVTGILSTPLDRLSQWVATSPKTEAAYLASLLRSGTGLEALEVAPPPRNGSDLVSDSELQDLFLREWQRRDLLSPQAVEDLALESLGDELADPDKLLAEGLASPGGNAAEAREELSTWLSELADPELEAIELEGLEGFGDWVARIKALKQAVARFVDTLRLVTRDRHLVAAEMAQTYGEVSLFVPALVDFEYTSGDAPSATVNEQVHVHSLLSQVSMVGKLPGAAETRIHPIVGYCPYREVATSELRDWEPDDPNPYVPFADPATATEDDRFQVGMAYDPGRAHDLRFTPGDPNGTGGWFNGARRSLDIVRHAVERAGFVGVKLYPPAGYLPLGNAAVGAKGERLDAALRSLYAYCQEMDVPILAHANHSNGFAEGFDELAGPQGWNAVLQEFPDLRLCFGHFGHLWKIDGHPADPPPTSWARGFINLVDTYPHVYGDVGNSRFVFDGSYRDSYLELLHYLLGTGSPSEVQRKRRARLMFGTDYWMNTMSPRHGEYLSTFNTHYGQAFDAETTEQFLGGNALRWLGLADDSGKPNLNNANRGRLLAFYGNVPRPRWLA